MVEFTTSAGTSTDSEGVILVTEGQSVEVCVAISGATISDREVVVQVSTSQLQGDSKAASKYNYIASTISRMLSIHIYSLRHGLSKIDNGRNINF